MGPDPGRDCRTAVANSHVDMVRLIQNTWFIATVVPWISLDGMSYSSVFSCVILFGTHLFLPTSVCRFIVLHMLFLGYLKLFVLICTLGHSCHCFTGRDSLPCEACKFQTGDGLSLVVGPALHSMGICLGICRIRHFFLVVISIS